MVAFHSRFSGGMSFAAPAGMGRSSTRGACVSALLAGVLLLGAARAEAEPAPPNIPACPSGEAKPDVASIVKRVEQTLRGTSSVGTMSMGIKTKAWSRTLKMKIWAKGSENALVRIIEGGPRETGMMTLKRDKQLWNYLPQAGRIMKLPSGMMGDSWMGSDFTNDDLVQGSSMVDDYDSSVTGTTQQDGHDAWKILLKPRPKAVVVWGSIEMTVDRQTCLPIVEAFFDEDGKLARRMTYSDFRQIGWRQFPSKMTVYPLEEGRETSITYGDMAFDVPIPDDTFSLDRLRQEH
jgi:outer membrane lipoprotein-sorting protein